MKLFVYPSINDTTGGVMTARDVEIDNDVKHLFEYLFESEKIVGVTTIKTANLWVYPHIVRNKIKNNEDGWEKLVLRNVADFIKEKELFGFKKN